MSSDRIRALKLLKLLEAFVSGQRPLVPRTSALFFEAIVAQPDAATCISIISSQRGLGCIQRAMRFDLTPSFFNGPAKDLLKYISVPDLARISGGIFLTKMITAIVEPPIFWSAFTKAFEDGQLSEDAQLGFAWLLLQLISLPGESALPHRELAKNPAISARLLSPSNDAVYELAIQIQSLLDTLRLGVSGVATDIDPSLGPGGRHDNDFADFRDIAILPTADELSCKRPSFLRPSAELDDPNMADTRVATHIDNQFRLLREDMLYEMREELDIALGKKKGKFRGLIIEGLTLVGLHHQTSPGDRDCNWGIALQCRTDLYWFKKVKPADRVTYLKDNKRIFRHQSMTCLIVGGEIVAFATVNRDEVLLAKDPPMIVLQLEGVRSTAKALLKFKMLKEIKLLQIDTAVFAYEPILTALKEKHGLPLTAEMLFWTDDAELMSPPDIPTHLVDALRANPLQDLQHCLQTPIHIKLDKAQAASLLSGLTQQLSLIQGPPGTGKSFIGALIAKALHDFNSGTILVVCYTNHALDQFLEDLLRIGIPDESIVRLGGKSTPKTSALALQMQTKTHKLTRGDWNAIDGLRSDLNALRVHLQGDFHAYQAFSPRAMDILNHLELELEETAYFDAFCVPQSEDGMQQVGCRGKAARPDYLFDRWRLGLNAGMYMKAANVVYAKEIWQMPPDDRQAKHRQWEGDMLQDRIDALTETGRDYNQHLAMLEAKFGERDAVVLRSKRIIGCTTTAAAKYREQINAARPSTLLVEEAGEILESHILTALHADTKQLVLIGDHKQLRPKVNNYSLTVEKGDGLDLNRSLFERLVLKGYPHETLREQHRMRPEISDLVRQLTYPDLLDADGTKNRPDLRGVQDIIVFINHDKPEDEVSHLQGQDGMTAKASKQNMFEVQLVLKIVQYLGQQGYGTDKIVIITPYLGQLRALQLALKKDNDPVLNDLDSFDLVRAGLLSPSAAKVNKKPIRLATIDNYQGEESDIVIISLTRSNSDNDIGFMSAPERLTVLLSRARDALIMIGNADTFMKARKGNEIWKTLFTLLRSKGHIYGGFPVKCEQHPGRTALLKCADDFDEDCPDGGCRELCGITLGCGVHFCPLKCHPPSDHSNMLCEALIDSPCPQNHRRRYKCHQGPPVACAKCDDAKRLAENESRKQFERQEREHAKQRAHVKQLADLDEQIARERDTLRDVRLDEERKRAIEGKLRDLQDAANLVAQALASPSPSIPFAASTSSATPPSAFPSTVDLNMQQKSTSHLSKSSLSNRVQAEDSLKPKNSAKRPKSPPPPLKSSAQERWQHQKDIEGASNPSIDAIMAMTGLEEVKEQVLRIKDNIDTIIRQNAPIRERFNVTMLGNPGTGKTTVARYYGKFLASLQVIPGDFFVETTGSRLANDGVSGAQKHIDDILRAGGGIIFVDEAYQLTTSASLNGSQVLDFLLAEIENLVGKVVFIFAGYDKEMEKFFEHNPGLPSRVPYSLRFKDYDDAELLSMLESMINKYYQDKMRVDDEHGIKGLYGRIAVRRLGRGRGTPGFGNARALDNMFAQIRGRLGKRLAAQRREGHRPDDFLLTKEDLIGPDPSKVMGESAAWKKLNSMIGLDVVKKSVTQMCSMLAMNYQRDLLDKVPHQVSLNRVFLGSPGTGKTTVAKCYGQILADLGMISNGEVVMKNPSDFIGGHLGQSEAQTRAILASTVGKVLVIDEAYMLHGGSSTQGGNSDPYKTAVIDTIVAEVQSNPGDDRCVLMLGYKHQMEEMFQNVNPGLSRRFSVEDAFIFDDLSDDKLLQALEWKLNDQDLSATDAAKKVAKEVLSRLRNRPNFGNIGEVENLLGQAKLRYQQRQGALPLEERAPDAPFEPEDFDPDFNRGEHAASNLTKLFKDIVGCDNVVKKMEDYQRTARNMKAMAMNPREQIPTTFIFKGPPGTGKTTVARKVGQIYYDMGFLSSTEVVECSASDLVGQYVGQTGPKTRKLFEKALGRVLFIDEAYRLSEGHFAQEAIDEMVGLLTQETFRAKLVVILAGYNKDMDALMQANSGLSSRFPDEIVFHNISPAQGLEILKRILGKKHIRLDALEHPLSVDYTQMGSLIEKLSRLPSWGNARDIETLSKKMAAHVFTSLSPPVGTIDADNSLPLFAKDAVECIQSMLSERQERIANVPKNTDHTSLPQQNLKPPIHTSAPPVTACAKQPPPSQSKPDEDAKHVSSAQYGRDAGVTSAVWNQLQTDKAREEDEARRAQEAIQMLEQRMAEIAGKQVEDQALREKLETELAKKEASAKAERQLNEARIREQRTRAEAAKKAAELEAKRREEERKRREEAQVQTKIREMGLCVAGFRWIKQATGYRCAGGSHFISNAALGI